jgi:hypothetical protein
MAERRSILRRRKPRHRYSASQVGYAGVHESVKALAAKLDEWQERVFLYADLIPEVMTGYLFVANVMDLVTFEIQRYDRSEGQWVPDESPEVRGVERKINLAFKAGRAAGLGHLVEEAFILVDRKGTEFCFETLSPTEIRSKGAKVEKRVMVDGDKDKWVPVDTSPGGTTVIRVYSEDPKDRNVANGPHKALLGLLETMALEILRDQADATSVLAGNGILLIPSEILPDEVDTLDASDTPGSRKGFETQLQEAMLLSVTDRRRGEAIVPITLYGEADVLDKVRHIIPGRKEGAQDVGARMDRYVQRYARSIDLPAQVITGIGEANHWGDWKVDENTWAYHLYPRGQRIADALYDGVVRHVLRNLGRDPDEYRMVPNATRAIAKTDMTRAAVDAYKVGALKPEPFIEALGFEPGDLREDAEETLLLQLQNPAPAGVEQQTLPDRTAASANPRVILRQAARIANQHQAKLDRLMRRILERVAADAARDGKAHRKEAEALAAETGHRVAADEIPFIDYKPGTYFARYRNELEKATLDELGTYLRRIATVTGTDYRVLKTVWATEFAARAEAVARTANEISERIASSSYQSGRPARVLNSQVRTLSSQANGGATQLDTGAKNLSRPTHAGEDPVARDTLVDSVGEYATQYTWVTGHPMQPFPPHQELDGRSWYSWQEFDELDVADEDAWLPGTVYFPGDHDGCQCSYEIDFVPREDAE